MKSKYPDYVITHVDYDKEHSHISRVMARKIVDDDAGDAEIKSRQFVILEIKSGKTFATATFGRKNGEPFLQIGANVEIGVRDGVEYLTTEDNNTTRDNLGELPDFSHVTLHMR